MAFESTFNAIDKTLRHDEGCSTALDYVEQSSWILFLKYFDDLEETRELSASLIGKDYRRIIDGEYRWSSWAMPRNDKGEVDRNVALVGDDLKEFVNEKLFPSGVFIGAGVKTVVLFFKKGEPTRKVWFYQLDKHFTKTAPLSEKDLEEFVNLIKTKGESENSWSVSVADLDENLDLSVKNPNKKEVVDERTPEEIANEIIALNDESRILLEEIMEVIG